MKLYLLPVLIILLFVSCSKKYENLETVEKVQIEKYLGSWYEIARYEHSFEKDCKNVKATYSINNDKKIKVINECVNINTNKKKEALGIAYTTNETNSKLRVSFFRPFYGDYWILMLGDNYEYALIGEPSREYLWILSRTKKLDEKIKKEILIKLPNLGFNESKLIWTIQE